MEEQNNSLNKEIDLNQSLLDKEFQDLEIPEEKSLDEIIKKTVQLNNQINKKNIKVLFILGMDSSIYGNKANYLRKHFKEICIPDIQVSYYKLSKSNSILKNLLKNWLNLKKTGMEILQSCVDIISKEIQQFQPDIVLGMSMGGAVLTALLSGLQNKTFYNENIQNNVWNGPTILIAPALETLLKKTFNYKENKKWKKNFALLTKNNKNIHIIHGTKDKVIPYKQSLNIIKNIQPNVKLETVYKGNHKLNNYIIQENKLVRKINEVYLNQH